MNQAMTTGPRAAPESRGFRRALGASFVLHVLVLGLFAKDLFGEPPAPPAPLTVSTALVASADLEPDLPPLDLDPPATHEPPAAPETLAEVPPPAAPEVLAGDPAEPPGPPAEILGIRTPRGFRRGAAGVRGGGGHGGRSDTGEAAPVGIAVDPVPPAPRDPVLAPPRIRVDRRPAYPASLRQRGAEGEVRVRLRVDADGAVSEAAVAVSSGSDALDEAAVEAARGWTFDPATEDGRPVAAVVYRWVRFHLVDAR
jgi:protein TonB